MPIKKAAFKSLRQSKKRELRNKKIKDNLRKLLRSFRKSIELKKKEEAEKNYLALQKALDKAAKRGVIKKNTAARKKSRLMKKLNMLRSHEQ